MHFRELRLLKFFYSRLFLQLHKLAYILIEKIKDIRLCSRHITITTSSLIFKKNVINCTGDESFLSTYKVRNPVYCIRMFLALLQLLHGSLLLQYFLSIGHFVMFWFVQFDSASVTIEVKSLSL